MWTVRGAVMGVAREIRFPAGAGPTWPGVVANLAAAGETPILRMIDGQPAFPDETPADDWTEVRVGLAGGMVTLRRVGPGRFTCVTWGAADPALARSWDLLCWAVAAAGEGVVSTPAGDLPADQFRTRSSG